ncbi:MAG TPA: hypothetical protein VFE65_13085 [Pseudonocardia sp.]|nr:hypothetical protein [Pseudonocardia sp.]
MRSLAKVLTMAVGAIVLVAGVWLGLTPIKASITQIKPELRLLSVSCGNGYLGVVPPVQHGNLVELPDEAGVYLPQATFDQHCSSAVGWRKYASWGLTGLGVLALAIAIAASSAGSTMSSRSRRSESRRAGDRDDVDPGRERSQVGADDSASPRARGTHHRRAD